MLSAGTERDLGREGHAVYDIKQGENVHTNNFYAHLPDSGLAQAVDIVCYQIPDQEPKSIPKPF